MKTLFLLLILILMMILILIVLSGRTTDSIQTLAVGDEISIPSGYSLVAVSAYGRFQGITSFYCQNNANGKVYVCNDGHIGTEIIVPSGYTIVEASAYGEFQNITTFYCKKNGTNRVFKCNPE